VIRGDRVLLVERGNPPLQGYWSLPGGVLEAGETLVEGVCREALEETGLAVKPLAMIEIFERIIRDSKGRPEYHYVLIDYLCTTTGGKLCAADDACRVRWVARHLLPKYQITEGTVPVIEKAFSRYEDEQRRSPRV
jgi:ADP-ribose pyrophosphatase YjhB (NUDIX family)